MRTEPMPKMSEEEYHSQKTFKICDVNRADEALECIDELLKEHGLEVVLLNAGSSSIFFKVEKTHNDRTYT